MLESMPATNCAALRTSKRGFDSAGAIAYVSNDDVGAVGTSLSSSRNPGAGNCQSDFVGPPSHAANRKTSASVRGLKSHGTLASTRMAREFGISSALIYACLLDDRRTTPPRDPIDRSSTFSAATWGLLSAEITSVGVLATITFARSEIACT